MERGLLNFLIYSFIAILTLMFSQCSKEDAETKQIQEYVYKNYEIEIPHNIKRIYILNDSGCGNCILTFSEFVKNNINDHESMVIINSRGANIDLEGFENKRKSNSNIVISHNVISNTQDLFYKSGVALFKGAVLDSIIRITPDSLIEQLDYIKNIH
nr:hypothetical protein [uncultured Bacteroides sp.]